MKEDPISFCKEVFAWPRNPQVNSSNPFLYDLMEALTQRPEWASRDLQKAMEQVAKLYLEPKSYDRMTLNTQLMGVATPIPIKRTVLSEEWQLLEQTSDSAKVKLFCIEDWSVGDRNRVGSKSVFFDIQKHSNKWVVLDLYLSYGSTSNTIDPSTSVLQKLKAQYREIINEGYR
jgi:hypothetical protein